MNNGMRVWGALGAAWAGGQRAMMVVWSLCIATALSAQPFWIVGDTTGHSVLEVNVPCTPNAWALLDLDCNVLQDIVLAATGPEGPGAPWVRLSCYMQPGVEVYNAQTGLVQTFAPGDTLWLNDDAQWTPHLDFIYGTGEAGAYGQYQIEEKYIAFRRVTAVGTEYLFVQLSTLGASFTLHRLIGGCPDLLVSIIHTPVAADEADNPVSWALSPNPTTGRITVPQEVTQVEVFTLDGRFAAQLSPVQETADLGALPPGMYVVRLQDGGQPVVKILRIER